MTAESMLPVLCLIAMTPITLMVFVYAMSHRGYSNYDQNH
jgi:hypothetical protein